MLQISQIRLNTLKCFKMLSNASKCIRMLPTTFKYSRMHSNGPKHPKLRLMRLCTLSLLTLFIIGGTLKSSKCSQMLLNILNCYQMLPNTSECFQVPLNIFACSQMHPNTTQCLQTLANYVSKLLQMLSNAPTFYQLLKLLATTRKCFQMLSNVPQ